MSIKNSPEISSRQILGIILVGRLGAVDPDVARGAQPVWSCAPRTPCVTCSPGLVDEVCRTSPSGLQSAANNDKGVSNLFSGLQSAANNDKGVRAEWGRLSEAYKRGRIKQQNIYYFWFWRDKAALLIRPGLIRPGLCSPKAGWFPPRVQMRGRMRMRTPVHVRVAAFAGGLHRRPAACYIVLYIYSYDNINVITIMYDATISIIKNNKHKK